MRFAARFSGLASGLALAVRPAGLAEAPALGAASSVRSRADLMNDDAEPLPIGELSTLLQLVSYPEWADLNNGYLPEVEQHDWLDTQTELSWRNPFDLAVGALASDNWTQ